MQLVADPDLEGAVEDVEELVLAGVDVRRGPAAGRGEVLEEHEASAGALAGRLERHRVADDPDPFALARGEAWPVLLGVCVVVMPRWSTQPAHQRHFIWLL